MLSCHEKCCVTVAALHMYTLPTLGVLTKIIKPYVSVINAKKKMEKKKTRAILPIADYYNNIMLRSSTYDGV